MMGRVRKEPPAKFAVCDGTSVRVVAREDKEARWDARNGGFHRVLSLMALEEEDEKNWATDCGVSRYDLAVPGEALLLGSCEDGRVTILHNKYAIIHGSRSIRALSRV
ncbi:hypothetical protein MRX96_042043 [Rhipicephalus microplus]